MTSPPKAPKHDAHSLACSRLARLASALKFGRCDIFANRIAGVVSNERARQRGDPARDHTRAGLPQAARPLSMTGGRDNLASARSAGRCRP